MIRVLFVCTGNICRSPTADGVFRQMVENAGLAHRIDVDSCGTTGYHVGEKPDPRAREFAQSRGYDLSNLRARQLSNRDFTDFDYLLAMDDGHLATMQRACPKEHQGKLRLFLDFHPDHRGKDVPDPYYGGQSGFVRVFDLVEETSGHFLRYLHETHGL